MQNKQHNYKRALYICQHILS